MSAPALPPIGLTQITNTLTRGELSVVDGVAFVSTAEGVYPIDERGIGPAIVPIPPDNYADLERTTRVVAGPNGVPHFAAEFGTGPLGSLDHLVAVYATETPTLPAFPGVPLLDLDSENSGGLKGLDSSLRALVNDGRGQVIEVFPDGSSQVMSLSGTDYVLDVTEVASDGTAVALSVIPGTLGAAGALIAPDGRVVFLDTFGSVNSIRVSDDGSTNIGFWSDRNYVRYGAEPPIGIDESIDSSWSGGRTLVSESRFTLIADPEYERDPAHLAYFPGVSDESLDRSVALEDLFPELTTIDYHSVAGLASHEGQIHLLLSGDQGLWLFAAPDPSLVPEPVSSWLAALALATALGGRGRGV